MALPKSKGASAKVPRRSAFEDSIPADNSTLQMKSGTSGEIFMNLKGTPSMVEDTEAGEGMETGSPSIQTQ